jgi:tight adherence protein C
MKFIKRETIRKTIGDDLFVKLDKELKNVGGTKILYVFPVNSIEELFSAFALIAVFLVVLLFYAVVSGTPLSRVIFLIIGTAILSYVTYKKPIDTYKDNFMKDNELPAILNTIADALSVGMPVENILTYIAENKKGQTADLIRITVNKINAGIPAENALKEAAEKSMNPYFRRAVNILIKTNETPQGLAKQITDLYEEIEEEKLNIKTEKAAVLDNALFFPILIGFIIPLLVMVLLPFVNMGLSLRFGF